MRIGSAHNKCESHCPNFAFLKTLNWNAGLYSIRSIANQKSVRYSVSSIKFYNYSSSKCKQAFVYISDCNLKSGFVLYFVRVRVTITLKAAYLLTPADLSRWLDLLHHPSRPADEVLALSFSHLAVVGSCGHEAEDNCLLRYSRWRVFPSLWFDH